MITFRSRNQIIKTQNSSDTQSSKAKIIQDFRDILEAKFENSPHKMPQLKLAARSAITIVQSAVNGEKDYLSFKVKLTDSDAIKFLELLITDSTLKESLEKICAHQNAILGDKKINFFGTIGTILTKKKTDFFDVTNFTSSAENLMKWIDNYQPKNLGILGLGAKLSKEEDFPIIESNLRSTKLSEYESFIAHQSSITLPEPQNMSLAETQIDKSKIQTLPGGVHKKFDKKTGMLYAMDNTGIADFKKEAELEQFIASKPELTRRLSLQSPLLHHDNIAQVKLYANEMTLAEFLLGDNLIAKDSQQASLHNLIFQIIHISELLYINGISHRDLHMQNIKVIPIDANSQFLQIFDFGRGKFGKNFSKGKDAFADIDYMFLKKADRHLETFKRNSLRSEDDSKQQKHYPLHKLLKKIGISTVKINSKLTELGIKLKINLQHSNSLEETHKIFTDLSNLLIEWVSNHEIIDEGDFFRIREEDQANRL